jgi:hypothetical protein
MAEKRTVFETYRITSKLYNNRVLSCIMDRMGKCLTLFLFLVLAVSTFLGVGFTIAESINKPQVPEFSLNYTEHHTIYWGYEHSLYIIIKNQPFVPFQDSNGKEINLFFNVSWKGQLEKQWHDYPPYNGSSEEPWNWWFYEQNGTQDTIIYFDLLPNKGKTEFRVEAHTGFYDVTQIYPPNDPRPYYTYQFIGQSSGWSSTQTLHVSNGSTTISTSSTSPTPSPSATVPEFFITASLIAVLAAVSLSLIIVKRKVTDWA